MIVRSKNTGALYSAKLVTPQVYEAKRVTLRGMSFEEVSQHVALLSRDAVTIIQA